MEQEYSLILIKIAVIIRGIIVNIILIFTFTQHPIIKRITKTIEYRIVNNTSIQVSSKIPLKNAHTMTFTIYPIRIIVNSSIF